MLQSVGSSMLRACVGPAYLCNALHHLHRLGAVLQQGPQTHTPSEPSSLSISRAASTKAKPTPPTAWEDFSREIEQHAKGSATFWPEDSKNALSRVNEALGRHWALVDCEKWNTEHPRAGQEAYAVVHMAMAWMLDSSSNSSSGSSSSKKARSSGVTPEIHLLREPVLKSKLPPGSSPIVYYATYELGNHGWPNGRLYNSPSQFECLTTRANNKKAENSFRIISQGMPSLSLYTWTKRGPGSAEYGMKKPNRTQQFHIANWYRDEVQQLGVDVLKLRAIDAATRSVAAKKAAEKETK